MFPDNHDVMYRYARMRSKAIGDEVEAARGHLGQAHILRRRAAVLAGVVLVALTLAVTLLAMGWWVI